MKKESYRKTQEVTKDMDVLDRNSFPPLGYDDAIRVALLHQSILRDIRVKSFEIDLTNCTINELIIFVKFCKKQTN